MRNSPHCLTPGSGCVAGHSYFWLSEYKIIYDYCLSLGHEIIVQYFFNMDFRFFSFALFYLFLRLSLNLLWVNLVSDPPEPLLNASNHLSSHDYHVDYN